MDRNKPLRLIGLSSTEPEKQTKLTLNHLCQLPAQCPIEKCISTVFKDDMLQHLAQRHFRSNVKKHLQVAFNGERCTLVFDVSQLIGTQTICLGVLLYGGVRGKHSQLPGEREFCYHNRLKEDSGLESLKDYLPIMVLVKRTTFLCWALVDRKMESQDDLNGKQSKDLKQVKHLDFSNDTHPKCSGESIKRCDSGQKNNDLKTTTEAEQEEIMDSDILIIWTQSAPCIRPLHVAMTVFNSTLSVGRSAMRCVANSGQMYTEIGGKDLPKDRHSLLITQQELKEICGAEHHLHLELILHEPLE